MMRRSCAGDPSQSQLFECCPIRTIDLLYNELEVIFIMEAEPKNSNKKSGRVIITPILILLAIIYFGFLLYQAVYVNFQTNKKISESNKSLVVAQGEQGNLKDLIAYYQTGTFQELEARKKLGLKMPGEKVVKVTVPQANKTVVPPENIETTVKKSNPELWLNFLSGGNF